MDFKKEKGVKYSNKQKGGCGCLSVIALVLAIDAMGSLGKCASDSPEQAPEQPIKAQSSPLPPSDFPNVLSVMEILYENESITDTGRYSRAQQEQIFTERYKGKQYFVDGKITDVGTSAFGGRKYITIKVTDLHSLDVYPSKDFDLLDYSKGQQIGFVGTWTNLGTGIMTHHKIEQAASPKPKPSISPEQPTKAQPRPLPPSEKAKPPEPTTNQVPEPPKPPEPSIFESSPMPMTGVVTEDVLLTDETGKKVNIPINTRITVTERKRLGSLVIRISGTLFVGDESDLIGKFKPITEVGPK